MGGLIVRYAIQKVEQRDSHFPSVLYVSDVVTFSSPEGGITVTQAQNQSLLSWCNCTQVNDMVRDPYYQPPLIYQSDSMKDVTNYNHPDASGGTDWTMMGSLSNSDFLDWQVQATYMSNSNGNSNNHRIGFSHVPSCLGQPGWNTGYGHGDYLNDQCDGFDASYYYCDGCSRDQKSFSFASNSTPHSLHNMLFAFVYANW